MHPILFSLGKKSFYTYGLMAAIGFIAAILTWTWLCKKQNRPTPLATSLACWLMLSGLLGARLAYVLANLPYYLARPIEILRIDRGGLIFYGGFIVGAIALLLFSRRTHWPLWQIADFTVPGLAIGHAFGRIGCFFQGCCYGAPATAHPALGLCYPPSSHPGLLYPGIPLYPVQLIESAALFLLWALLLFAILRPHRPGTIFALYLLLYPPVRFSLEYLRGDERLPCGPLNVAQLLSLLLFLAALLLFALLPTHPHQPPPPPSPTLGKK